MRNFTSTCSVLFLLCFTLFVSRSQSQTPTVSSLQATGTGIKWYSAASGGTLYAGSEALVDGQTYYATQTVNGCESTARVAVTATLISVSAPAAGTHTPSQTEVTWNWNTVTGATGYKWGTTNVYANATDMGSALTKSETGLTCNTSYSRYIWAYNASGCVSGSTTLTQLTVSCEAACGSSITINHVVSGGVAPVDKTVTYGTVTGIPGEPTKCWITRNLGAAQQATMANDATEASAGWYFQFNRKQGYQYTNERTPNGSWDATNDNLSSTWEAANDPCTLEIGTGWRIPTNIEWTNIDASGNWINWNDTFGSELKLHVAGNLSYSDGTLYDRGLYGFYWSGAQFDATIGWNLYIESSVSSVGSSLKAYGFTTRCIRDY